MARTRTLTAAVALCALVASARADPPAPFLEKARGYQGQDRDRLPMVRAELEREVPGLFSLPLPPCPLRSALARALSPEETRALLGAARTDPARLAVLVDNLASRRDLGVLIQQSESYGTLEADSPRLLAQVAANALLDGDPQLALRLLEGPAFEAAAEMLSDLLHPEGLRTLADVVTGRLGISPEGRARLAAYEPDVWNDRAPRPLGPDRIARLVETAAADPDPAIRTLAARLLLRSNDPAADAPTVRAFLLARSAHLRRTDWHALGKVAPAPVTDGSVSIQDRLALLEAWQLWTWRRGEADPGEAEAMAAALRPALASAEPRFRGEAILFLVDHDTIFVTTTHHRKRAAPSFLALLQDLEAGRPGDAAPLVALGREAAARLRAVLEDEEGYPAVRVEDRPLASEANWRPAPPNVDAALARFVGGIDGLERFEAGLSSVADPGLPAGARRRLFEELVRVARDGEPTVTGEAGGPEPPDPRYFERLVQWISASSGSLDGGLTETCLREFAAAFPEGREAEGWAAFDRALESIPEAGPRLRLAGLRERSRSGR